MHWNGFRLLRLRESRAAEGERIIPGLGISWMIGSAHWGNGKTVLYLEWNKALLLHETPSADIDIGKRTRATSSIPASVAAYDHNVSPS